MAKVPQSEDVTNLLNQVGGARSETATALLPLVYDQLRRLASRQLRRERPDHTLQATALVHEAYLRLVEPSRLRQWQGRWHFFAAAAEAMRRILVERARSRNRVRHGGGRRRVDLPDAAAAPSDDDQLLDLDDSLTRLAAVRPQAAELVRLRVFAGLRTEEAAPLIGLSTRTTRRLWAFARAWLRRDIERSADA